MDIYQVLKNDHDELKEVLNELCSLRNDDDYRFALIDQVRDLLIPHSRAEESVFYNTLRAINADHALKGHGFSEHMAAESLLRSLQAMDKLNASWKGTAEKLRDAVFDHIESEGNEVFAEARSALSPQEADSIGSAFQSLKPKVQEQGVMKNTMDMVINMMPPRFADKIRNLGNDTARP
ncbi:MAG: hemerythrin domain-containing protein [Bacteriovoracia bacterium]